MGCCYRCSQARRQTPGYKDFREKDDVRVMLATIEAAAHGLTWTAADIAVFRDKTLDTCNQCKAEDRLHWDGAEEQRNFHCKYDSTWNRGGIH